MKRKILAIALCIGMLILASACAVGDTNEDDNLEQGIEDGTSAPADDGLEPNFQEEAKYGLPAYAPEIPALKDVFAPYFLVGAAVNTFELVEDSPFYDTVLKHYNVLVLENELKPEAVEKSRGTYDFTAADAFTDFGKAHGMQLRGHTLVWHRQVPDWWFRSSENPKELASSEELLAQLEEYITTLMTRYKGKIHTWDVVNEVVADEGSLRGETEGSLYASIIGDLNGDGNLYDYVEKAFHFARAADPQAQLILNDYALEQGGEKLDYFYDMVKDMLERGVPIDGTGLQMHVYLQYPSISAIEKSIETLAALREFNPDFQVQITELDVSIFEWGDESRQKEITPALAAQLAQRYGDLFALFQRQAEKGNIDMVLTWGVYDGSTWLDAFPIAGRTDAPLLFDRDLKAKPAFWGVIDRKLIPKAVAELFQVADTK